MTSEIFLMNGYGGYVWSAFSFTLISFASLYLVTKFELIKQKEKFVIKFGTLNEKQTKAAKIQNINREILEHTLRSKI